ncbi:D-erythronate dehydrogenase [Rhodococcoides kyotonense]|uniref:Nucleoside-diphosphate-sugar epimerase n=1 Tax=Rhodococcoides kyotonense TaxID=398843 RepID=A0A239N348_9NOCA|nr:D-erythronate dehydrogenase [Rhodococcus kyotonensis]SNT48893.1 Nucleoside-diphosphate-sugar epimerase [Rhodococcus kyotonensis]
MTTRIAITGGAGFLGTLLAQRLLAAPISVGGAAPADVTELVLVDLVEPLESLKSDPRVSVIVGDLDTGIADLGDCDAIFHLAGVVSGAAEADFDLGMRTNLDGTRKLLDHARGQQVPPVVVFSSSLAVFGIDPYVGAIGTVDDDTLPRPQSSYGIQKFIGEQLVADYTRKGYARGRTVRLMTVSVRPGKPNAAASSFMSGIIREPIAGEKATCPIPPDFPIALSSPRRTVDGLVRAASVDDDAWGSRTAMNLPALTTTPAEMAKALDLVTGKATSDLIAWGEDSAVTDIVGKWPSRFVTPRASALGLEAEQSFEGIVREYIADFVD